MMKFRKLALVLAASALTSALTCGSAGAAPINAWRLNLSLTNGLVLSDGSTVSGATDATNVDHLLISGSSTIAQTVTGGNALGNPFSETGALQFLTNIRESPQGPQSLNFGTAAGGTLLAPAPVDAFLQFVGLTGTLNGDGSITFNPGSGTVSLFIENDDDTNPLTGGVLKLATYQILAPSGGSNLNFFGGTAANATVDVTAKITSVLPGLEGLFADNLNVPLTTVALHLVNTDSLLDPNFSPNPDNSGINTAGNGVSIIHVQNAGQYNLALPEPGTLLLLGIGLAGLGFGASRQKKSSGA